VNHTTLRDLPLRIARVALGLGRLCLYLTIVGGVLAFVLARTVSAQVGERSIVLGRELAQFQDLLGGAHRVLLNGQPIYIASAVSDETMDQVLDRFEAQCAKHTGGLKAQFDALPPEQVKKFAEHAPVAWSHRLGIFREEHEREGSIACLERPNGEGLASVAHALTAFARSGDLRDVGNMRYAYVRRTGDGRKVSVISSFTEGSFRVYDVVGKGREEPTGEDPPATPRPPRSRRLMSAAIDAQYGAYVFESNAQPAEVLAFYDAELPKAGWLRITGQRDLDVEVWQRDGRTMVVHAAQLPNDPMTQVVFSQGRTTAPAEARR
jgi:hypothetical protein